jgi:glycosyltransferase involved in cell wall biosynthesis
VGAEVGWDVDAMGLHNVHFVGEQPDAATLFREFDLLCLPSREDAYSRVALECAVAGVPSVGFRDIRGWPVFAAGGGGLAVEPLDVVAMADAVRGLIVDGSKLEKLGTEARERIRPGFDVNFAGPVIANLMTKMTS